MFASGRAVLLRYRRFEDGEWKEKRGSALAVGGNVLITCDHCADGSDHRAFMGGVERAARVLVRSHDSDVDVALLEVPDLPDAGLMGLAFVDQTVAGVIPDCQALGYPIWKDDSTSPRLAQLEGNILSAENTRPDAPPGYASTLTLKLTTPDIAEIQVKKGDQDQAGSQWQGVSGSAVVAADRFVVGVIRSHATAEGVGSLTLTPLAAIATLPTDVAAQFWRALKVDDPSALPYLPPRGIVVSLIPEGQEGDDHARLIHSALESFRLQSVDLPLQRRTSGLEKLAAADLVVVDLSNRPAGADIAYDLTVARGLGTPDLILWFGDPAEAPRDLGEPLVLPADDMVEAKRRLRERVTQLEPLRELLEAPRSLLAPTFFRAPLTQVSAAYGLAVGYLTNLILPVGGVIWSVANSYGGKIEIDGRDVSGATVRLNVAIPDYLEWATDEFISSAASQWNLLEAKVTGPRPDEPGVERSGWKPPRLSRPRTLKALPRREDGSWDLVDLFPTTMGAMAEAIDNLLGMSDRDSDRSANAIRDDRNMRADWPLLERKEIGRFHSHLIKLLDDRQSTLAPFVNVVVWSELFTEPPRAPSRSSRP
jgi:hypothetical protein